MSTNLMRTTRDVTNFLKLLIALSRVPSATVRCSHSNRQDREGNCPDDWPGAIRGGMTPGWRHAANIVPLISEIRRAGVKTFREIADALNARGIPTPRGGRWFAMSVRIVMARPQLDVRHRPRHDVGHERC